MVKFLIHRPIAVILSFIAIILLGIVAFYKLPVSLLPDVDTPVITVQINGQNRGAFELEQEVVSTVRQQLSQTPYLDQIYTETRDGFATISLRFEYGRDLSYAFIDVNEKVDNLMRYLPKGIERPAIIKASSTDLPVFYLNVKLKDNDLSNDRYLQVSDYVTNVVRKRFEQLPEVAMVDITGRMVPELRIIPNMQKMRSIGLSVADITAKLRENNQSIGSIQVKDGQYCYNIHFANGLHDVEDIKNIFLKGHGHLFKLKDLADVSIEARKRNGMFLSDGDEAISMAIIKQADAKMESLNMNVENVINDLSTSSSMITLEKVRDQTGILRYAISNLLQSLFWGSILGFVILFFFLRDARTPWLIGVSIPISLVMSLLFFFFFDISINIISLSGLILGVGMMIDNAIIVIDNISQKKSQGFDVDQSCIIGATEVIRPMFASVLTTCAVFLPLIFLSGITGALFYDQAMAVTIGLFCSLVVSVLLIPVLFRLINYKNSGKKKIYSPKNKIMYSSDLYKRGWKWVFLHRKIVFIGFFVLIIIAVFMSSYLPLKRFPNINQNEVMIKIDWNEPIHIRENRLRTEKLLYDLKDRITMSNSYVGTQQFLHHNDSKLTSEEVLLYLSYASGENKESIALCIDNYLNANYHQASFDISYPPSAFQKMFQKESAPLVMKLEIDNNKNEFEVSRLNGFIDRLNDYYEFAHVPHIPSESYFEIVVNSEMLMLYDVNQNQLFQTLKTLLCSYQIEVMKYRSSYLPIVISDHSSSVMDVLHSAFIKTQRGKEIPVSSLITIIPTKGYKNYYGDIRGGYYYLPFRSVGKMDLSKLTNELRQFANKYIGMQVFFDGSIMNSRDLLVELVSVLCVALLLLYFILAAQFESLTQPLIVLLEVPMDIAGALFLLFVAGESINIMALIGIVVMSGIIINDSILKIDTINQLRKEGWELMAAIEEGGKRRLKPIVMTSLTTILALVPFLFGEDLGSSLQKPLALVIIGGMIVGTIVSLYFVPLCYYFLQKRFAK